MIPRIVHQIWIGPAMPAHLAAYVESWKAHHPAWEHRLWDDFPADLDDGSGLREAYDEARNPAAKSDFLRLAAVWKHGGLYADVDIECHKPIDELLVGCDAVFTSEYDPKHYDMEGPSGIASALFGASPGHPAMREIIEETVRVVAEQRKPRRTWRRAKADPLQQLDCGPRVFRRVVHRRSDVRILEQDTFHHYLPPDVKAGAREPHPDAYGTHWFEQTWVPRA